nr:MAG: capsid protein [Duck parvovirus]
MSETICFKNCYMTYINNNPYQYPSIEVPTVVQGTHDNVYSINTGWHIIPNFLWRHAVIPRQWDALIKGCEAYHVKAIDLVIYNPIPITTNLSLQRVNYFSAFNNCTYALTYTDDKYETSWYPWYSLKPKQQLHLAQREGLTWYGTQIGGASNHTAQRYEWPIYWWKRPNMRTCIDNVWSQGKQGQSGVYDTDAGTIADGKLASPSGVFWDPFNCPEELGELRAGKNSISFHWEPNSADCGKWFNLDVIAAFSEWTVDGPYCGEGRPDQWKMTTTMDPDLACTYGLAEKTTTDAGSAKPSQEISYADYTIPNYYNMPIVPTKWFWKEIQNSIVDWYGEGTTANNTEFPMYMKANKYWSGTEWETYKYPPNQWFTKGIVLYDAQDQLIKTTTQVSVQIKLTLEGKKRRSAYFCPTYGPTSGDQLYYQANNRNIFQPACIRYRTGGGRRTWQNMQAKIKTGSSTTIVNTENIQKHPRMDNFYYKVDINNDINSIKYNYAHTISGTPDKTDATRELQPNVKPIKVVWTRDTDTTEIIMEDEDENNENLEPTPAPRSSKLMQLLSMKK